MDVIQRIDELMKIKGWSDYKLATKSGLSSSTIANIHRRNTIPSIPTLEAICQALGISMSQFFEEDSVITHLSKEDNELINDWKLLNENKKRIVSELIKELKEC